MTALPVCVGVKEAKHILPLQPGWVRHRLANNQPSPGAPRESVTLNASKARSTEFAISLRRCDPL
jgi:hypothetical protein